MSEALVFLHCVLPDTKPSQKLLAVVGPTGGVAIPEADGIARGNLFVYDIAKTKTFPGGCQLVVHHESGEQGLVHVDVRVTQGGMRYPESRVCLPGAAIPVVVGEEHFSIQHAPILPVEGIFIS